MHGNVWEWCGDWYGGYPFSAIDPIGSGPAIATERVMRGGSFDYVVLEARSSNRGISSPTYKYGNSGFRLAKTP
jgi:formylglycine-generating enzyme required for sulfatase activity